MGSHGRIGHWSLSRKRSASSQSRDGRPLPKKFATPYNTNEEVQDLDSIAKDISATVRTIYAESDVITHYFWQATALPHKLPEILARIEENMEVTAAPVSDHWIYIRHGIAGSELFMSSIRTSVRGNMFKKNLEKIVQQTKRDHPGDRITFTVLIYRFEGFHPDNCEQRTLVNGMRDDLPREVHTHPGQGGMEEAHEIAKLKKRLAEGEEELRNALQEANLQIARLEDETSTTKEHQGLSKTADEVGGWKESLQRREQEVATLQATIKNQRQTLQERDQDIASARAREEALRHRLKELLDEKYARDLENLERQKKEIARQKLEELESFGPC